MSIKNNKNNKKKKKEEAKFRFTKADLITKIAKEGGVTITETEIFYNIFEKVLTEAITHYSEVILSVGLGRFVLKTQPAGKLTNVKGKKIYYPESTVVKFKISNTLKQAVKKIKLT
ncbi:HU family DNA-binding protein ['Prunus avium' virescence phytoplasma]|uniref:HU family DNA-binding protein n=1 Tax='Prunus avium' virescence phytoplasma TaxID=2056121 RepID=UPI003D805E20